MSERSEWYAEPKPAAQQSGLSLWGLISRRKWFIVLGFVVAVALGYLYYVQMPPVYESTSRVLVSNSQSKLALAGLEGAQYAQWDRKAGLATQAMLIRSPLVVQMAIEGAGNTKDPAADELARQLDRELDGQDKPARVEVGKHGGSLLKLRTLTGDPNPVATIIEGLWVEAAAKSAEILDLTYRSEDPDDCRVILEAVITSYKSYLKGAHNSLTKEAYKLIEKAKNDLSDELVRKERAYRDFRSRNAAQLFKGAGGKNIHQERLMEIEQQRSDMLLQRSQISAELATIEAARKAGLSREAILMFASQQGAIKNPVGAAIESIEKELLPLMLEEQRLMQFYGADHRDVVSIRQRIETTRDVLGEVAEAAEGDEPTDRIDWLAIYVDSRRQKLAELEAQERDLTALFDKEQLAAKGLEELEVQDENFQAEIERKQKLFDAVVKRLEEINLTEDLGGYDATQIWTASRGTQVEPNLLRVMAVASFLGIVVGFGLALTVETADKRFLSPMEIQQDLALSLFGHVPLISGQDIEGVDPHAVPAPILCTYHKPQSNASEAYRAVRTSLYFSTQGEGHKVVQVTSPSPGDGKTTLACNLAVSIAQSNKQVLLVDADFRRPQVHKLFGTVRRPGLSTVIEGKIELHDAIKPSQIENLSLLTCGSPVDNPSELLTSPDFEELINVFREKFDFVIVDTPPLLAVTDPSVVAARVDGVLLTMRLTKKARTRALHATDMLSAIGANVLGMVVNGISKREGYGGYHDYTYGYSYSKYETSGSEAGEKLDDENADLEAAVS